MLLPMAVLWSGATNLVADPPLAESFPRRRQSRCSRFATTRRGACEAADYSEKPRACKGKALQRVALLDSLLGDAITSGLVAGESVEVGLLWGVAKKQ
jgi:hypothetical protein